MKALVGMRPDIPADDNDLIERVIYWKRLCSARDAAERSMKKAYRAIPKHLTEYDHDDKPSVRVAYGYEAGDKYVSGLAWTDADVWEQLEPILTAAKARKDKKTTLHLTKYANALCKTLAKYRRQRVHYDASTGYAKAKGELAALNAQILPFENLIAQYEPTTDFGSASQMEVAQANLKALLKDYYDLIEQVGSWERVNVHPLRMIVGHATVRLAFREEKSRPAIRKAA